jgi:hypothetical protein
MRIFGEAIKVKLILGITYVDVFLVKFSEPFMYGLSESLRCDLW